MKLAEKRFGDALSCSTRRVFELNVLSITMKKRHR
jgi:hypothetical protein